MQELIARFLGWLDPLTVGLIIAGLLVGLIFSPTRAVIGFFFKIALEIIEKVIEIAFTILHEGAKDLVRAHAVYFRNWLPRDAVIKSVRADSSTRKL